MIRRLWRRVHFRGVAEAKGALEQSVRDRPEVERLAHDLRARRSQNHFGQMILKALGEPRK